MTATVVATVSALHIYPVKGLGGISLAESAVARRGLAYDRRFLVIEGDEEFLTQREIPKMATVWVELDGDELSFAAADMDAILFPAQPEEMPSRMVRVWNSHVPAHGVSEEVDAWLSDYLERDVHLVYMPDSSERKINPEYAKNGEVVSFADGYPLLLTNEASLADLNARMAAGGSPALPMNRFRPNVVVKGAPAWAEDKLGEVRIGDAVFRAAKPCARCQVTTTDQASGEVRGPEPLKTLSSFRDSPSGPLFGMNLIPVKLATIRVGDAVSWG